LHKIQQRVTQRDTVQCTWLFRAVSDDVGYIENNNTGVVGRPAIRQ